MAIERLSQASVLTLNKYSSMMAGSLFVNGFELIATQTLAASAASVTFTGLDVAAAPYKHLQVRVIARTDSALGGYADHRIRFNGDSATNYSWHDLKSANASSVVSTNGSAQTGAGVGYVSDSSQVASVFSPIVIDILNFSSLSIAKSTRSLTSAQGNSSTNQIASIRSGAWYSTAAITSLNLFPPSGNYVAGSRFSVYGIKG